MKRILFSIFLLGVLAACTPAQTTPTASTTDVLNVAVDAARTEIALTQAAIATATPEATPTIMLPTPSPYPTNPPIITITPNAIQVEQWQEYQTELAKPVLFSASVVSPNYYDYSLCEWVILGHSEQKLYLWVICSGPSTQGDGPAIVHLTEDGSIQEVDYIYPSYSRSATTQELFPEEIQELIMSYNSNLYVGRQKLYQHLQYRTTHPDVPPLIIRSTNQQ